MKREILFFALAGLFSVNAVAQNEVKFYTFEDEGVTDFQGFSSNGRYVVGNAGTMGVCYDRMKGELMMTFDPTTDYPESEARGISNDAVICGKSTFSGEKGDYSAPAVFNFTDSVWTALPLEKNTGSNTSCNANAITGDGRFMVGNTPANDVSLRACMWEKGSWENGELIPLAIHTMSREDIAWTVSEDGTLVGGCVEDSGRGLPILWKNGEMIDLSENSTCSGKITYISRNGKYACGRKGEYQTDEANYMPFIWHSETGEIIPVQIHDGASGGMVYGISEDGKILAGFSMFDGDLTSRKPFIIIDGEFNDLGEYMETLGWEVPEEYQDDVYGFSFFTLSGMSPTGTALCGMMDVGHKVGWIIEFGDYNYESESAASVESTSQSSLSVYPNPVKDRLYIQGDCLSATVYNQAGVSVLSSNSVMEYLDMSNLEKGIYYVKLVGEKETATKKVIVK